MNPFSDVFPLFYDANDYRVNQKNETVNNKMFDESVVKYELKNMPEKYQNNGVPDINKTPNYLHKYDTVETFRNNDHRHYMRDQDDSKNQVFYFLLLIIFILIVVNYQQYKLIKKVIKSGLNNPRL